MLPYEVIEKNMAWIAYIYIYNKKKDYSCMHKAICTP